MTAPTLKVLTATDSSKSGRIGRKNSSSCGNTATFETIGDLALAELDGLLRKFMDRVDDVFFERSDKADSERERKNYFDAMREFRNRRDGLQEYFAGQMRRSLAELVRQSAYGRGHDEDVTRIEVTGTEDKIAIDNLISRARLEFADELYAVAERIKSLLGTSLLDADDNPFDPGPICENFHAASELLKIDISARLIFYKLLEKHLMASLGEFYRKLNRQFIEHGVLPTIGTGGTGIKAGSSAGAASKPKPPADRVVDALTRVQMSLNTERSPDSVDPQKFRRAIRQKIDALWRQHGQSPASRDGKSAEAVFMLFDFFFEDEALPDPIKVLIGRLQVPILKVAILEPDFLTRKQHSARRLLDNISRASLGCGDSHRETRLLVGKTCELVDFIVARYDTDTAVFDAACREFEIFMADGGARREQATAAPRKHGQAQIKRAREATSALIGRLTSGRELDPAVVEFLHTTWTSVLVKTYLSLGESSNHWRNLKRISTTLVWTLIPRHSEEDRDKIMRTIPALLRALAKGMTLIRTDMQIQNRVFELLAREHARVVRQTSQNIVTRVDDITVWPEDDTERELAMSGNIDDEEIAITCVDPDRIDADADVVALIDSLGTNEVIKNLNQFTAGVKKGSIRIDEEIVLSGDDDLEFELDEGARDSYLELASELPTGSWVEFIRPDESRQVLRLFWKSAAAGTLVFVNGNGQKVKNMTVNDFAAELRAKTARCVQTTAAFGRAFFEITSKLDQ